MLKPNLFFVGQHRTGSHALHDLLGQHPEIFTAGIKEPAYFATDIHRESDAYHGKQKFFYFRTEEQYLKLFENVKNEKYAGDIASIYLYSKEAAKKIYRFNKDSKIIMMFREPVDWLNSYHQQACHFVGEDCQSLRKALELEGERKEGYCLPKNVIAPSLLYYSDFLKYSEQLKRYLEVFDKDNIKIFMYEDFKQDNMKIYDEIMGFLGVDRNFRPTPRKMNASKAKAKFPEIHEYLRSSAIRKLLLKVFPSKIYQKLVAHYWQNLFHFDKNSEAEEDLSAELMVKLKPEVEALSELVGRDLLSFWGYN